MPIIIIVDQSLSFRLQKTVRLHKAPPTFIWI